MPAYQDCYDPENNAQNLKSLLGKILRIDVNVAESDRKGYRVPLDNPFVNNPAAFPEIWSIGLRNPTRFSFDDFGEGATGALIMSDLGQGAREEINYQPEGIGGRNYGWRLREGSIPTPSAPSTTPGVQPLSDPVYDYPHTQGASVTGGFVYRGTRLPARYRGRYFFADFTASRVWSMVFTIHPTTREATAVDLLEHTAEFGGAAALRRVAAFGRDAQGELYFTTFGGRVYRIVSTSSATPVPPVLPTPPVTPPVRVVPPAPVTPPPPVVPEVPSVPVSPPAPVPVIPAAPPAPVAPVAGPPNPPRDYGVVITDASAVLSWSASPEGPVPTGYQIEIGSVPGGSDRGTFTLNGALTNVKVQGIPAGTYYTRLRSINGDGPSLPTAENIVIVHGGGCRSAPPVPYGLVAMVSERRAQFAWAVPDTDNGPTALIVEAGSETGAANLAILAVEGSLRAAQVTAPPGIYFARLRAQNACGTSAASNEISIRVY